MLTNFTRMIFHCSTKSCSKQRLTSNEIKRGAGKWEKKGGEKQALKTVLSDRTIIRVATVGKINWTQCCQTLRRIFEALRRTLNRLWRPRTRMATLPDCDVAPCRTGYCQSHASATTTTTATKRLQDRDARGERKKNWHRASGTREREGRGRKKKQIIPPSLPPFAP